MFITRGEIFSRILKVQFLEDFKKYYYLSDFKEFSLAYCGLYRQSGPEIGASCLKTKLEMYSCDYTTESKGC